MPAAQNSPLLSLSLSLSLSSDSPPHPPQLSHDARLSFKVLREIFQTGFSRIPVHGPGGREDVIGLVMVKDLIFVDPEDETPVQRFAEILGRQFEVVQIPGVELPVYARKHCVKMIWHDL